MAQQMLDQFHATHPNIRVFYIPDPDDLEGKMLASMQAGTAPDVFQGCCTHFPTWAQQGYTLDLRPYVKADVDQPTIADWDPAQYRALFTPDGRQFGLPKYHGALALYYNRDLFDQHGIDYPDERWDYAAYLTAMKRFARDRHASDSATDAWLPKPKAGAGGDGTGDLWGSMLDVSWDRLQVHVNGFGGHFVDPADPTRCRMADPEALQALEWIRARMWDERVMATPPDVHKMGTRQAFVAGKLAMVEDGSWALKDTLTGAGFRVGVAPFPAAPVRRATLATTDGFGIFAQSRYPEAAWELMQFLIGKDYGRAMARAHFLQPARASLVEDWISYVQQQYPEKIRDVDLSAFAHGHVHGYSVTAEVFSQDMAEAKRLADAAWVEILGLGQAPVDLMKGVCEQLAQIRRARSR
jgi:multiple sugar transport system substrate-binding protein